MAIPRLTPLITATHRAWRASLQLRVVTITLVTSGVLVATFGLFLSQRITDGLVSAKEESAVQTVTRDSGNVQAQLRGLISDPTDTVAAANVNLVLTPLRDRTAGVDVEIVSVDARARQLNSAAWVPPEVTGTLQQDGFYDQRLVIDTGNGAGPQLYLVVGRVLLVGWGSVQLIYFYPLDGEIALATEFSNIIAATGIALVIMLVLVAYLVTRMVVTPVRVAARTAQRLSNGLLDQRMEVNGEDDLAALAASFNQMAENLQRHILRLEEMSRLQRRFTSDVSHELRTPLTTVRMAADLIYSERDGFDAPVARSAELLHAELDRFEALLAELLEISRFDAGFAALDSEPANLGPLVERAVSRLAPVAERAGVTFVVDLPADPVVAEVDVRRVERILRNLIGNAIEHGEGRPVKVRLAAREGAVAVTVRDYGVGLKTGEEKLVFNRFWRADPSRARHTGGTGLGLSISVEDARLHGGWLEAWGAPGQGAQFRLTVPSRAGDRLVSSPLRLVPTDFRAPNDFRAPHDFRDASDNPDQDGADARSVRAIEIGARLLTLPLAGPVDHPAGPGGDAASGAAAGGWSAGGSGAGGSSSAGGAPASGSTSTSVESASTSAGRRRGRGATARRLAASTRADRARTDNRASRADAARTDGGVSRADAARTDIGVSRADAARTVTRSSADAARTETGTNGDAARTDNPTDAAGVGDGTRLDGERAEIGGGGDD